MFEWVKIWFKEYQTTFDSTYSIEECVKIFDEQLSAQSNLRKLGGLLGFNKEPIVIEPLADGKYQFTTYKLVFGAETPLPELWANMTGTLQSTLKGTRITVMVGYNKLSWWYAMIFYGLVVIIGLPLLIAVITSGQQVFTIYIITLAVLWLVIDLTMGRPLKKFTEMPYTLLGK